MIENQLKVMTLGGLSVQVGGNAIDGFVSRKVAGLLVYLLANRRAIQREVLADLLWDKLPPARALANLRTALWDLQHNLGDCLHINNQSVAISDAADVWFDVAVLEAELNSSEAEWRRENRLTSATAERLIRTLALYGNDFLAGFFLRDSEVFEVWLNSERERLRKRVANGLHHLAIFKIQNRDFIEGVQFARQLVALDPTSEDSQRLLMRFWAYTNQRAAALAQFQTCKQILAEEFGVEPSQETVALFEEIQADKVKLPAISSRAANNLPSAPTAFVERPHEINKICELLDRPDCHLLTLLGPGGMGKSRLALQMVWQRITVYRDGVYFVALAGVNVVEAIPSSIVLAMQVDLQGHSDLRAQLFNFLRDKHILLVLDNFEHLLNGALMLSDLVAYAPNVKLLVTSRERLNIQEEWLLEIEGMNYPTVAEFDDRKSIREYSALELFSQTARRVYPDFSLDQNQGLIDDVIHVCQLVEGMPLGIELAAAHLRFMSCHDIAQQIERNLDFLSTSLHNIPVRHRSIRMLFDQSLTRLTSVEQLAFMKLAVFHNGADREAAEAVAGATLPILSTLVERSLIHFSSNGRYEMHELVRRYALEGLIAAGQQSSVQEFHCDYFSTLVESSSTFPQVKKYPRLEADYPNILAALEWVYQAKKLNPLLRLCSALLDYWQAYGTYQEGYRWLTQSLDLLDSGAKKVSIEIEIGALDGAGIMAWLLGELEHAEQWLLRSLQLRRANQYENGMCVILDYLSVTYLNTNQFERCLPYIQEALDLAHRQGDNVAIAQELLTFGLYATHTTDWDKALHYLKESLAMFESQGNVERAEIVVSNMAVVYIKQGLYSEAQACCDRGLTMLNVMPARSLHSWAIVYGNMGEISQKQGLFTQAREQFSESLKVLRQVGDKMNMAYLLESFGGLEIVQSHTSLGVSLFGAAKTLRSALGAQISPREAKDYAYYMQLAHEQLGPLSFEKAWASGEALSLDEAVNLVLNISNPLKSIRKE